MIAIYKWSSNISGCCWLAFAGGAGVVGLVVRAGVLDAGESHDHHDHVDHDYPHDDQEQAEDRDYSDDSIW